MLVLADGASTQPFCMHARALTQANVSGTRVWLYLLQHARASEQATRTSRDLGAHHVVDFFKQTVWLDLIRYHYVYAPQEGMSSV